MALSIFCAKTSVTQKEEVLRRGAPIHPSVLLCLPTLFRSYLSQNQRSLFAFLASNEPHGFQEFLTASYMDGNGQFPFYRLPNLYDYIRATMGSTILTHYRGKAWAEIENALDRIPADIEAIYYDVVKAIGLLSILGNKQDLRASHQLVQASLGGTLGHETKVVNAALEKLLDLRIIVYRKYSDSYAVWEGSDIDLLALYNDAHSKVGTPKSVEQDIGKKLEPYPFVARKHFFKTGTLRSYDAIVIDEADVDSNKYLRAPIIDARLVFVFPHVSTDFPGLISRVQSRSVELKRTIGGQVAFAVVRDPRPIIEALRDVRCWEYVAKNAPQLEGDRIAQKELWAQLSAALTRLDWHTEQVFDRVHAHRYCVWILNGKTHELASDRAVNELLSANLDRLYPKSVVIHNELINRTRLSAAAAAARGALMEHMIQNESLFRLGFEGTPPAVSMYVSMLESTGVHVKKGGSYAFKRPGDDSRRLKDLWSFIDNLLGESSHEKIDLSSVWSRLTKPPFGLRDGVVPVLLIAYFRTNEAEIALYENGSYLPDLTPPVAERMIKSPTKFSVQRYTLSGVEAHVFRLLVNLFNTELPHRKRTLLSVVRPLVRFVSALPTYSRNTNNISDTSKKVRSAILAARDPHALIFNDLPEALGLSGLIQPPRNTALAYLSRLKDCLRELEESHEQLLMQLRRELLESFEWSEQVDNTRHLLKSRASFLMTHVTNMRLKAFVMQLCDSDRPDKVWAESLGSCVIGKPPSQWIDSDLVRFRVALAELVSLFKHTEEAVYFQQKVTSPNGRLLRVAITKSTGEEFAQVVHVENGQGSRLDKMLDMMNARLEEQGLDLDERIMTLSELLQRYLQKKTAPTIESLDVEQIQNQNDSSQTKG